jgi:hypothetical protein
MAYALSRLFVQFRQSESQLVDKISSVLLTIVPLLQLRSASFWQQQPLLVSLWLLEVLWEVFSSVSRVRTSACTRLLASLTCAPSLHARRAGHVWKRERRHVAWICDFCPRCSDTAIHRSIRHGETGPIPGVSKCRSHAIAIVGCL